MIWIKRIGLILLIIFIGTIIDFCVHHTSHYFTEPFSYFTHKIAFGTLWSFVTYIIARKFIPKITDSPLWLAISMSAVTSILLQFYYFVLEHDPLWVTVFFMFVHFFCFLIPGYYILRKYKNLFI